MNAGIKVRGLSQLGIEPVSIVLVADALSIRPLIASVSSYSYLISEWPDKN